MTLADPLRVVLVGAGLMGRAWRDIIEAAPDVELAAGTGARAIVNVTVPAAHHEVSTAALFAGLDVLCEKPVADTVDQALSMAAASEATGRLLMVSQSRRWNPQLFALRAMIEDLGAVGALTAQFFKAPRFNGFRATMAHPLLVDMAIHAFDSARFLLGAEPVSAYCEAYNPPWSWFEGDAAASAVFTMDDGARFTYTGSWCSPGAETSWNAQWRVSGEKGSASWDGDTEPVIAADVPPTQHPRSPYAGIGGALQVFVEALDTGAAPMGEVHENVMSLVMVEAAVLSAETGQRVVLDDVLARAYTTALAAETRPEVKEALLGWPSPRSALARVP